MGLTRYGYYPCGAGASVDRVFGFDIGIKELSSVGRERMKEQLAILCPLCGYFKNEREHLPATEDMFSPTWEKALENYRAGRPGLSIY